MRVLFTALLMALVYLLFARRLVSALYLTFAALAFAYFLEPMTRLWERKIGRGFASLFSILIVIGALLLLIAAVMLPALMEIRLLPAYIEAAADRLTDAGEKIAPFLKLDGIKIQQASGEQVSKIASRLIGMLISGAGSIASLASGAMVVIALTYFYLADWDQLSVRIAMFIPVRFRAGAIRASGSIRRELGQYLRAQAMIVLSVSVLTVAVLYVLASPMPLALGLMYGLMNAIPYFGPLFGTILPVASALSGGWQQALATLAALLLIQQIDAYVLQPRVMGAMSGASPAMILIALAVGSSLAGVTGMFLALPALVSIKAAYRSFTSARDDAA